MKVKKKKYQCSVCGKSFNWSKKSSWYGQLDEIPEAVFCSKQCQDKFQTLKTE